MSSEEADFVEYAENLIMTLQKAARTKPGMEFVPVIEACSKLEEMAYQEAQKDSSLSPAANVWQYPGALDTYQDICEAMLRNLEMTTRKDWEAKFTDNPPVTLFRILSGRAGSIGFAGSFIGDTTRRSYVDDDDFDHKKSKRSKGHKANKKK